MMNILKNLVVLIGLVLVAGLGYYLYTTNGSIGLDASTENLQVEAESAELLRKIDSIKQIKIDRAVFSDPRFTNLRSFATPVPVYPVGRDNPFQAAE